MVTNVASERVVNPRANNPNMSARAVSVLGMAVAAWVATGCVVEPAPVVSPRPGPPRSSAALAIAPDALDQLERSATLDGDRVNDVAPGAAAPATIVIVFASWCVHCRDELAAIDQLRALHPGLRTLGVNYRAHEEYDNRGDAERVRAYVGDHAPWLVVVPVDDAVFAALGRPPKVPTLFVYDHDRRRPRRGPGPDRRLAGR